MLLILSLLPFIVFLFLLLVKRTSLLFVSLTAFLLTLTESVIYWQVLPDFVLSSLLKGFFISFDIFVIIFGALFFLKILEEIGVINNISYYLGSFSKDYRVQVISLAWFFENFLEGTAGFGTAGAIVAPLLVGLGLSPITAVVISLLGNSTSVAFGAAGTPIRVGFAGLNTASVPIYTALINCLGFLVPVFMLWILVSSQKRERSEFFEALPFAVWSGVAFVVPSVLFVFLGQEFPSILGSVTGFFLVFLTNKAGIFLPKTVKSLRLIEQKSTLFLFKDFFPYALLIIFLIAGKFLLGSINIGLFGINYSFNLFNPGLAFLAAGLPAVIIWGRQGSLLTKAFKTSFNRTKESFLVIFFISVMVQLIINSGNNLSGFPSLIELIAKTFETAFLPFLAPIIGAFGSFITGSATISNIMFGSFLSKASGVINLNSGKILALELVGASAGNMISLADMITAEIVVGLKNQERHLLGRVIFPCLIYILLAGLIGMLIV